MSSRALGAHLRSLCAAAAALVFSSMEGGAQQFPTPPLVLDVPSAPRPFARDGGTNLVYEIHITNLGQPTLLLRRLEVLTGRGDTIATFEGPDIATRIARPVPALKLTDARMIEGGRRAVIYLWLTLPRTAPVPSSLRHRVMIEPPAAGPITYATNEVLGGEVRVSTAAPVALGLPLRGGLWIARFNSNDGAHRRTIFTVGGRPRIVQRFAIDFGKVGPDGRQFKPNGSTNADMYGYEEDVLAVSDGVVASMVDSIAENDPTRPLPPPSSIGGGFGNHIVLALNGGSYAFYGHLKPGSIRVRQGERVRKGQVIAQIGNSGNATGPHLHFQMMDGADMTTAEGVPYIFDRFTIEGIESLAEFQSLEWHPSAGFTRRQIRNEMPGNGAVLRAP
jgi:murein DD-endopeptidase